MIELTPSAAVMLYLGITLFALLGLWFYHHYKTRHRQIFNIPTKLFVCEYCHCVYQERADQTVTRCPQCQSFNKENTYG